MLIIFFSTKAGTIRDGLSLISNLTTFAVLELFPLDLPKNTNLSFPSIT